MSKADFTAQQAAIAPAIAELDRPKIEVGQVWRCRDGGERAVFSNNGDPFYPRNLSDGSSVSATGHEFGDGENADADLMELVQDASGFTIWRGGEQPAETRGKRACVKFRSGGDASGYVDQLEWRHSGGRGDVVAYKVVEAAAESPAAIGIDPGAEGGDRHVVGVDIPPGYHKLFGVLMRAFEQAAGGKGKERHAKEGVPFEEQPMSAINKQLGSVDGFIYQAHKKSLEAKRLPDGRAQAELLGSINYLCGAVIALDTWAKKDSAAD